MNYPGNPSLSPDVQLKTQTTFEQTLELVARGRDREALAGCEFILGLDPLFRPAQRLQDRLRSQERPVKIDDLRAGSAGAPPLAAPSAAPPDAGQGDDDLLDLQRRSLSLDSGDDAFLELGSEALDISDLGEDSDLADLGDLDDLDLDALPELDSAGSSTRAPGPASVGAETLPFGTEIPAEADEPITFGEDTVALGEGDAMLELGQEPASVPKPPPQPAAAPPIGPIPGMPDAGAGPALEDLGLGAEELDFDAEDDGLPPDTGSDDVDEGGRERIAELLAEGQEVFEQGDYQGAIDVWSRIFLIDISNGPASQRIEAARKKKAELERQAEEIFHEGVAHIESASLEEAKDAFRRVLQIDAAHSMAREYLGQLEAGKVPAIVSRSSEAADLESLAAEAAGGVEGSPSMDAAVMRDRVVVVKKADKKLVALAALVAVVVIGGGGYVFFNRDKLFPNTTKVAPAAPKRIDPIVRATKLYESGETEKAIAALERLPADDPSYEEGRALLAQWNAEAEAEDVVDTGPSPELLERRNLLLAAARVSQDERRFLRARKYFERAHKILPLESEDLALKLNCDAELRPLADEIRRFREREYKLILRGLWEKREAETDNHDVNRLIVDSYYNLSLLDLQRGDAVGAAAMLQEARDVDPEDQDVQRLLLFAETYSKRGPDILYKIFVKYLPERDL